LQGHIPSDLSYNLIEVQLLQFGVVTDTPLPSKVQDLLALFAKLFAPPEGLPPKRAVTHSIPLLEGARPVHTRPYRFVPELKEEIEWQITEMLNSRVIRPSSVTLLHH
jgi:hypothetical protein